MSSNKVFSFILLVALILKLFMNFLPKMLTGGMVASFGFTNVGDDYLTTRF